MDSKSSWTKNKRTEIVRWLAIAVKDRGLAGVAVQAGFLENAVYSLHQSAEKLLKAFLFAHDAAIEKTHSIDALLISAALIDHEFLTLKNVGVGSTRMSELATYYRYPNLDRNDTAELDEVAQAVQFVDALYGHLKSFFGAALWADAVQHAQQAVNPFEDALTKIMTGQPPATHQP